MHVGKVILGQRLLPGRKIEGKLFGAAPAEGPETEASAVRDNSVAPYWHEADGLVPDDLAGYPQACYSSMVNTTRKPLQSDAPAGKYTLR